jgi:hypothetical protein
MPGGGAPAGESPLETNPAGVSFRHLRGTGAVASNSAGTPTARTPHGRAGHINPHTPPTTCQPRSMGPNSTAHSQRHFDSRAAYRWPASSSCTRTRATSRPDAGQEFNAHVRVGLTGCRPGRWPVDTGQRALCRCGSASLSSSLSTCHGASLRTRRRSCWPIWPAPRGLRRQADLPIGAHEVHHFLLGLRQSVVRGLTD